MTRDLITIALLLPVCFVGLPLLLSALFHRS